MTVKATLRDLVVSSPRLYALSLALQILRLVILIVPGLLINAILDTLTAHRQATWGLWALIALLVTIVAPRVALLLGAVAAEYTGYYRGTAQLSRAIVGHLLARPGARGLPYPIGDVVGRLTWDVAGIVGYLRFSVFVLGLVAQAAVALGIMLSINATVTLAMVAPLIGGGLLINVASARLQRYRRASRDAAGDVSTFLREIFGAVQAIQVAGAQERVVAHFRQLNERRRAAALRDSLLSDVTLLAVMNNLAQVGTGIMLLLVGRALHTGSFTVGNLALFVYLLPEVMGTLVLLGQNVVLAKQTRVSLERLAGLMVDVAPNAATPRSEPLASVIAARTRNGDDSWRVPVAPLRPSSERTYAPLLEATHLTYRHPGEWYGIDNVNLRLERGSFTVITGRIGAGKTTLLRALLGLVPANHGVIRWDGVPIADPASFFVPPRSAYIPQVPHLFTDTLERNILLGLPAPGGNLAEAIHLAAMDQDVAAMDRGLRTVIGPRGLRLSGGQVQRTAAARAFIRNPALLVCDDVSSALDVETERALWDGIRTRRDLTCLVVSHRRDALMRAEHIIVLREGRVAAEGRLDDLLGTCEEMRRLWHGDLGEAERTGPPASPDEGDA